VFALAQPNTVRLLRVLSLDGPATACELAARLALCQTAVDHAIRQALEVGVIRLHVDCAGRYEVVRGAVEAAVAEHCQHLLGATA
jgi:predicted transcriptional regulator